MKNRNIFLSEFFLHDKYKNKWIVQMLGTIIFSIIIMLITSKFTEESINITYIVTFSVFSVFGTIMVYFVIILLISKIMKSETPNLDFFKASITITFIVFSVKLITSIIQLMFNIDTNKYDLLSLNILNSKSALLNSIDFYIFLNSYLLILVLYCTSKLKGKSALIFGIIFLIVNLFFNLFFTIINQTIM